MNDVLLTRAAGEPGGRNVFSCSHREWAMLVHLARAADWGALGTTYIRPGAPPIEEAARHSYEPGESRDPKCVDAQDAVGWAAALDRVRRLGSLDNLIESASSELGLSLDTSRVHFAGVLNDFIEYAFGGQFSFARATAEA
jgi:hypothetical protein